MKESPVKTKSYAFAVRIVKLFQDLCSRKDEFILSKQILRCGTSIGANVHEAGGAYSEKEFTAKLQIAYKEALEALFWLRLLRDTDYIEPSEYESLLAGCEELTRLLSSSIKTLREKCGMVCENADDFSYGTSFPTPTISS
jgi:four helix bundle protein